MYSIRKPSILRWRKNLLIWIRVPITFLFIVGFFVSFYFTYRSIIPQKIWIIIVILAAIMTFRDMKIKKPESRNKVNKNYRKLAKVALIVLSFGREKQLRQSFGKKKSDRMVVCKELPSNTLS